MRQHVKVSEDASWALSSAVATRHLGQSYVVFRVDFRSGEVEKGNSY